MKKDFKTWIIYQGTQDTHHPDFPRKPIPAAAPRRVILGVGPPCSHVRFTLSVCSDLALRNCFLTSDLNVKVGDYGIGFSRYKVSQKFKGSLLI